MSIETFTQVGLGWAQSRRQLFIFVLTSALAAFPSGLQSQTTTVVTNSESGFALVIAGQGNVTPRLNDSALVGGETHTVTATAAKGYLFANWMSNGVAVSASPSYKFSVEPNMTVQADFAANPFTSGAYHGLFYATNNTTEDSSGFFVATVNAAGAFTAKLQMPGQSHSFTGKFALNGAVEKSIARQGLPALTVALQMDFTNHAISGTISDGTWTANLSAMPAIYSRTNPAPQAGKYTLLISGNGDAAQFPGGNGFGSVTVSEAGAVAFSGRLGDGTPVVSASAVSSEGQWPFYSALYGGKGSILGWLSFSSNGLTGQTAWFKLPQTRAKLYPAGFTNTSEVIGSVYRHTNGMAVLDLTGGQLSLANGDLNRPVSQNIEKLSFNAATGFFKGSVTNPASGKPISVAGAVLQNQNLGGGYFLGTNASGSVFLSDASTTASATNVFSPAGSTVEESLNGISSSSITEASETTSTNGNSSTPPVTVAVSTPGLLPVAANLNSAPASLQNGRLAYWPLNDGSFAGDNGQMPLTAKTSFVPAWCGTAVSMNGTDASSQLRYNVFEPTGRTNFNCANGTIRFWFQPNWSAGSSSAPTNSVYFFETSSYDGASWALYIEASGTNSLLQFSIRTAGNQYMMSAFRSGALGGVPVTFQSNMWYQIALTYSPSNITVYTNAVLLATGSWAPTQDGWVNYNYDLGNGVSYSPLPSEQVNGFTFGSLLGQSCPINGQLAELETFNYPLTPQAVAAGFPTFAGATNDVMADSDYDGRSDLLETLVDGTSPTNANSVVPCRLGFWRFDSSAIQTEQGQPPLSFNNVSLAPSWSGTALYVSSDPASQVTYWDVFTNGWANINCRQGSLRFWFKPNWTSAPKGSAPFVYVGNTNAASSQWALNVNSSGAITLTTASNNVTVNNLTSSPMPFDSGHWMQITINYGANGTFLYTNGVLAATGKPVTLWPSLSDRNLGMVIGNNTAYNSSINGQFDEMETFNYELKPNDILQNFQSVQAVDSDLDGIPDLLEDRALPASQPFLGSPVAITGTIEAEQFDQGGPGVGYYSLGGNPASSYRPTGLFITNCDDLGLGYCLDRTRAGEWAQYTINVLVGQDYAVETRVAGIGTNGVFDCEFDNAATGFSTNTGPLTITTTNWTNVTGVVNLPAGTYTMKLRFLANGTDGAHVGRFNYISLYTWWQTGFTSTYTNVVSSSSLSTNNDWKDATNNAAVIQAAVNKVGSVGGGTILLPAGAFFVSQTSPNETTSSWQNGAVYVMTNNVEIAGAGKTNTALIAFNRATTIISVGQNAQTIYGYSNVTLRDLTIEGQPHMAVANVTNTTYEMGQLIPINTVGCLTEFWGYSRNTCNILITNCQFLFGDMSITFGAGVSNCLVTHCDFKVWGGTNVYTGASNNAPTNTANTVGWYGSIGIFIGGSSTPNINVIENTYNGNTNLVPSKSNPYGYVSTNNYQRLAPDGLVNFQSGGNFFIARNTILNYELEGVQITGGPSAVVGNTYYTLVSDTSCCALSVGGGGWAAAAGLAPVNYSTCFVGNLVYGGRNGQSPQSSAQGRPYFLNFSGNELFLYPPFEIDDDYPGEAVGVAYCSAVNVFGNTLDYGGHGVVFGPECSGAIIMNNNFANAAYRGIGLDNDSSSAQNISIINNILGEGVSFHVQLPSADSSSWFLYQNECLNAASQSVPVFCDPISSGAHISN